MKYYIFDKQDESFLKDRNYNILHPHDPVDAYYYLRDMLKLTGVDFPDKFITENYLLMKSCKIMPCEDLPQFQQSIDSMSEEDKQRIDDKMKANHPIYSERDVVRIIDTLLQMPDQLTDAINNDNSDYTAEALFGLAEKYLFRQSQVN